MRSFQTCSGNRNELTHHNSVRPRNTQSGATATEPREAYGARGVCSRSRAPQPDDSAGKPSALQTLREVWTPLEKSSWLASKLDDSGAKYTNGRMRLNRTFRKRIAALPLDLINTPLQRGGREAGVRTTALAVSRRRWKTA